MPHSFSLSHQPNKGDPSPRLAQEKQHQRTSASSSLALCSEREDASPPLRHIPFSHTAVHHSRSAAVTAGSVAGVAGQARLTAHHAHALHLSTAANKPIGLHFRFCDKGGEHQAIAKHVTQEPPQGSAQRERGQASESSRRHARGK